MKKSTLAISTICLLIIVLILFKVITGVFINDVTPSVQFVPPPKPLQHVSSKSIDISELIAEKDRKIFSVEELYAVQSAEDWETVNDIKVEGIYQASPGVYDLLYNNQDSRNSYNHALSLSVSYLRNGSLLIDGKNIAESDENIHAMTQSLTGQEVVLSGDMTFMPEDKKLGEPFGVFMVKEITQK